jgi:hypothetical protein
MTEESQAKNHTTAPKLASQQSKRWYVDMTLYIIFN